MAKSRKRRRNKTKQPRRSDRRRTDAQRHTATASGAGNLDRARQLVDAGRPEEAAQVLTDIAATGPEAKALRRRIDDLRWRKCFRQRKAGPLHEAAALHPCLALPATRVDGDEALAQLAASDHDDAVLAAVAREPDAVGALKALRANARDEATRALAGAWMLVLKGHADRALERFQALVPSLPRRADLGLAIVNAVLGRWESAREHWQRLGSLPGGAFPAVAGFAKWLEQTRQTPLASLMTSTDARVIKQALKRCPPAATERRAWLQLRLGDCHWLAERRQPARSAYQQAKGLHPAVRVDALKRLVHCEIAAGQPPQTLFELYDQLAATDRETARVAVDTLGELIPDEVLLDLVHPRWLPADEDTLPAPDCPAPWARLWLRRALADTGDPLALMGRAFGLSGPSMAGGDTALPRSIRDLDPLLKTLDAAYDESDCDYLRLLLRVFEHYDNKTRQRQICYRLMRADPANGAELSARYAALAYGDQRGKKRILAEVDDLRDLMPHDVTLLMVACRFRSDRDAFIERIAPGLDPAIAAFLRWYSTNLVGRAGPPPADCIGVDPMIDRMVISLLPGLRPENPAHARLLGERLIARPASTFRICDEMLAQDKPLDPAFIAQWLDSDHRAWQPVWLALTMMGDAYSPYEAATSLLDVLDHTTTDIHWRDLGERLQAATDVDDARREQFADLQDHLLLLGESGLFDDIRSAGAPPPATVPAPRPPDPPATPADPSDPRAITPQFCARLAVDQLYDLETTLQYLRRSPLAVPDRDLYATIATLADDQRSVLAEFVHALVTEATMFDQRVQADPLYKRLLVLSPTAVRSDHDRGAQP